ncbi:uncharacterized protein N7443_010906 [Penicillium atrosanguineum]|uniref:uncharacterized protein n=1 Tax=Penicillium atrosanguineum TaxID=1132637 RepID=UPI0023A5DE46|nr:uncharacterized protein N7443_010906 [Penicillium atrosanguineum]KAJ5290653.1 hypothetical protein N7443_010906 [Penicillium atrosanguineum]
MEAVSILSAMKGDKLKDSPQWRTWFARVKLYAKQKRVWDLCDPDIEKEDRPRGLREPYEPEYPEDGDTEERKEWRDRMDVYKVAYAKWEKQIKGLDDVNEYIISFLDPIHHLALIDYETPYDRLVYLKSRFARSSAYEEEIRMKWRLFAVQKPKGNIDQWLSIWDTLREQAVSLHLEEVKSANRDFLQAVKEVLPIWWQARYQEIVMDRKPYDTRDLIESFRAMYREIGPKQSSSSELKGSFSTWQDHEEETEETPKPTPLPFDKRPCPCGRTNHRHRVATCYALNEAARPSWFKPNDETLQKIKKNFAADPAWKKWVEKVVKDANEVKQKPQDSAHAVHERTNSARTDIPKEDPVDMCFLTQSPQISAEVFSASHKARSTIQDRWILDTGASRHICNDKSRFISLEPYETTLATGDSSTEVIARGTVKLIGRNPETGKKRVISLSDALYSPGFHTNLVSYAALLKKGGRWCQKSNCIVDTDNRPIVSVHLWDSMNLWLFDEPEEVVYPHAHAVRSSEKPLEARASANLWHRRFAHINHKTVHKLASMVDGVTIEDGNEEEALCETCQLGNAPRQVSRRPVGRTFGRFGRVHFDLIQLPVAYNGHRWISHFVIEGIRFHWISTHELKSQCQLAINQFVQLAKNWWDLPIKAFHYDNEKAAGRSAEWSLTSDGIVVYHSPPAHPEMNGYAERAGGVIILRMRMLMLEGKLPKDLWPEAAQAAVWLLNRTPTYISTENRWVVPWEEVRKDFAGDRMPKINLSNVRLYGSLAYCRIQKQIQSDKMNPRAEVGFLVGYMASNVWKIWFPQSGKVRFIRDAVFDESRKYSPEFAHYQPIPLPLIKEPQELDRTEVQKAMQTSITTGIMPEETGTLPERRDSRNDDDIDRPTIGQGVEETEDHNRLFSRKTVSSLAQREVPGAFPDEILPHYHRHHRTKRLRTLVRGWKPTQNQSCETRPQKPSSASNKPTQIITRERERAPRDINGDVNADNIVSGRRTRRARQDNDYAAYTTRIDEEEEPPAFLHAFAAGLYAEKPDSRRHRDDLPEPPKHWKDVINHPFQEGFLAAMRKELDSLAQKETYDVVERPKDRGKQILPLLWVFAYKFDQDGYLLKLKARICVRGDLETISSEEKRAATLAARTARMIFALVAAFDLDLRQRDAVTAFLNSKLNKETYTRMPEGFESPGKCWKLHRALYGLRISPRLWQQEAAGVLQKLGLRQVPEDPCVFVGEGILVFFYVDDILIASHRSARERAQKLERDLEDHWELTDHGDAGWFLNIRIIRDRKQRKLWLCQDSYITSVAMRYNLTERAPVFTPLPVEELKPYEGIATPREIHLYQQKVGSGGYATTITRPDAAKAMAKLAQFLTNPGPQHHHAADRALSYLYTTRYLAIEYCQNSGLESVRLASDASYGDHEDRKSSAGYICQVYGGPVDWKATKQRTVTTSTTEAELLGLSDAGKHLQWWRRLLGHVGFIPSHIITIQCDNERAIGLLQGDDVVFDTKLRHVDIHHHWLRQEVRAGRIAIRWTPTASMVADGLTKVLPRQKHDNFVRLLNMVDISHLID